MKFHYLGCLFHKLGSLSHEIRQSFDLGTTVVQFRQKMSTESILGLRLTSYSTKSSEWLPQSTWSAQEQTSLSFCNPDNLQLMLFVPSKQYDCSRSEGKRKAETSLTILNNASDVEAGAL